MSFVIDKTITDKPPKKRSFRSLLGTIVRERRAEIQIIVPHHQYSDLGYTTVFISYLYRLQYANGAHVEPSVWDLTHL